MIVNVYFQDQDEEEVEAIVTQQSHHAAALPSPRSTPRSARGTPPHSSRKSSPRKTPRSARSRHEAEEEDVVDETQAGYALTPG